MKRIANFIVEKRLILLGVFIILAILSAAFLSKVNINSDISKYLSDNSTVRTGMGIMEEEFNDPSSSTLKVVFKDLSEEQITAIKSELENVKYVSGVAYDGTETYNKDGAVMFVLSVPFSADSQEAKEVYNLVQSKYNAAILGGEIFFTAGPIIPLSVLITAGVILIVILLVMCRSYFEPVIFLINIGMAILINMGTNIIFPSVSLITHSIAAVLQVCLSMDYSIILINRYRQEKLTGLDNKAAMKSALENSFASIASSSLTTVVGMLCLIFMSFKIGMDLGLVLAKGVFISLVCIFFVLPSLIIMFDKLIAKTAKKTFHLNMDKAGSFSFKARKVLPVIFIFIFAASFIFKGILGINFSQPVMSEADKLFPDKNSVVLLYKNQDEQNLGGVLNELISNPHVTEVNSYATTIGAGMSSAELANMTGMQSSLIEQVYQYYFTVNGNNADGKIPLYNFINFLVNDVSQNPAFSSYFSEELLAQLGAAKAQMDVAYSQLVGENYSRMIITVDYPIESEETSLFIGNLTQIIEENFTKNGYLLGSSAMSYEMEGTFDEEMLLITLLSIFSIFAVVAITFRSIIIPLILVCIVQCAIYLTMAFLGILSGGVYFLALLVVQALLMGATIDYGILFFSYYKEIRKTEDAPTALKAAYNKSIHTILTSALILFTITGVIGLTAANATISQICITIAVGTFSATALILFALPSILALFDRFITKKNKQQE